MCLSTISVCCGSLGVLQINRIPQGCGKDCSARREREKEDNAMKKDEHPTNTTAGEEECACACERSANSCPVFCDGVRYGFLCHMGALSHGARTVQCFWGVHPTSNPLNGPSQNHTQGPNFCTLRHFAGIPGI